MTDTMITDNDLIYKWTKQIKSGMVRLNKKANIDELKIQELKKIHQVNTIIRKWYSLSLAT